MSIEELIRAGEQIAQRLERIREDAGAPIGEYTANRTVIYISGRDLQKLAASNPGKPIIINGEYHIAYIKDHVFHGFRSDHDSEVRRHPSRCFVRGNKVHFYHCTTLVSMSERGREHRYCATLEKTNTQIIDLRGADDVNTRLAWCKHCITMLAQAGGVRTWTMPRYKNRIAEYGDASRLMRCVISCYNGERDSIEITRQFFEETSERQFR